jgi:hypothetical protein
MLICVPRNQTPVNTLDNPFPTGFLGAPHRNPDYQQILLGGNAQALTANEPNGVTINGMLQFSVSFH